MGCGEPDAAPLSSAQDALSGLTVVKNFDPAQGQLPESVTTDGDGNFYFSMGNAVQKLTPDGTLSLYAQLPIPAGTFAAGVKFGPNGDLYVGSAAFDPSLDVSYVFRVSAHGTVTPVAHLDPNGFPNDLAFDNDGNILVTDPFLGRIWKIDCGGHATIWSQDPLLAGNAANPALLIHLFGADGIAMDKDKRNLYVGNLDYGTIVRIPINRDGSAGTAQAWVTNAALRGADGIAFDKKQNLYVAVHGQDQIATVSPSGAVAVVASGSLLDGPSSVVFGQHGNDKKNLYIANFAILRALGVKPGTPQPGLLKLPVQFGGQDIP